MKRLVDFLAPLGVLVILGTQAWSMSGRALPGQERYYLIGGLFLSTLTRNQIVAGILGFGLALMFWIFSWFDQPTATAPFKVLAYLGITNHMENLAKGVVELKDVVFYVSFIAFGLVLAQQSVESQRWRA